MEFAAVAYPVDPHSSSLQKEYVVFYATLEWLAFKFHLNIFHMLHRAPLRYVDVPAESTVDLRGLTQALVKKEKKEQSATFSTVYVQTKSILKSTADSRRLRQKTLRVRERPKKKRFRPCLDFEVAAHWAGRRIVFPNTSLDVGPSSLETLRQRLN